MIRNVFAVIFLLMLSAGCATRENAIANARKKATILPPTHHQPVAEAAQPAATPQPTEGVSVKPVSEAAPVAAPEKVAKLDPRLATAIQNLKAAATQLDAIDKHMQEWWKTCGAKKRGHYTSDETDRIEGLLFQYLVRREMLWNMVSLYGDCQRNFTGAEDQTRAFAIGYGAAVLLNYHGSKFVLNFLDESVAIKKINELHYRYDIPAGTYDSVFDAVTSTDNINLIRNSRKFFTDESRKQDSLLARIAASEPEYKDLLKDSEAWFIGTKENTDKILKKKSIILPDVANLLRQNILAEQARKVTKQLSDNLYMAQGLLFSNVSDIRQPMTQAADFNPDQVKLIKGLLQPGDVILTYTAGYMSNIFLPGRFKHGITYVGTPGQRAALGLTADKMTGIPAPKQAKLAEHLKTGKLETGYEADVIEAVSEGVIFNSLDYLLKTHINRMTVIRPRVSQDERIQAVGNAFLLLGSMYDFDFDFADNSYQCCTEVIYRSYNKRGGIDFKLVPRMAVQTLAADDIVDYYLAAKEPQFDFILYAEENPKSPIHGATVLTGEAGMQRLKELMSEKTLKLPDVPIKIPFGLLGGYGKP
ncbi:MAG: hypothetical protein C0404_00925 [Verrucomicrobia bacterium]|nr:hypothetical protein [Verrucomicrobiota bacterium]